MPRRMWVTAACTFSAEFDRPGRAGNVKLFQDVCQRFDRLCDQVYDCLALLLHLCCVLEGEHVWVPELHCASWLQEPLKFPNGLGENCCWSHHLEPSDAVARSYQLRICFASGGYLEY